MTRCNQWAHHLICIAFNIYLWRCLTSLLALLCLRCVLYRNHENSVTTATTAIYNESSQKYAHSHKACTDCAVLQCSHTRASGCNFAVEVIVSPLVFMSLFWTWIKWIMIASDSALDADAINVRHQIASVEISFVFARFELLWSTLFVLTLPSAGDGNRNSLDIIYDAFNCMTFSSAFWDSCWHVCAPNTRKANKWCPHM